MTGPRRAPLAATDIAPLVSTTWNQGAPYNNLCPVYSGSNRSATGCVATAMAQVMNCHQWPQSATTAIPGYTTESYGIDLTAGLPAVTFDWANMQDSYSSSATGTAADAVATLMQYCGYSVEMDYGPESGSNTDMVAAALKAYFDYNATTQFVSRSMYTYAKWTALIYHELANGRPVVYGGMSSGGGHEFVCDGYKYENNTDFFHINWGWGGLSDNYFVLSALDPDQQGIGGSSSNDGFHYGQDAVIGIQPSTGTGTIADVTANVVNLTVNSMTLSSSTVTAGLPVDITLNITNNSTDDYDGDVFFGISYQDNYYVVDGSNFSIPAGETVDCVITYTTPGATGTLDLVWFLPNAVGSYSTDGTVMATLEIVQGTTNEYVPVYGYYCDELSRSQFIIPAANLEDMAYATLNGVTFYAQTSEAISWGAAQFDVYLSEVGETTFADATLKDWSTLDKVYSGSLSIGSNGQMKITFDTPYQYMGGNLLVGVNQTTSGSYSRSYWIGTEATGASLGGYNTSVSQKNFLPTATFDYTPGEAPAVARPTGLTVSYTGGTTAEVSWPSTESAWDIDVNGIVTENVTNPYTLTGLELATVYTVKVRAKNGSDVSDWSAPATFTTDLSDEMCQISFKLTDDYGDGWNGAAIQVVDALTGIVIGTVTNSTNDHTNAPITDTILLPVPAGRDIQFVWVSGSYDDECSFKIYDVNGELIYEFVKDNDGPSAGVLDTYHVDCVVSPWRTPSHLAASEIGPHSALLSWTENGAATAWVVGYKADGEADFTEVSAATNPFTLTGLAAETEYTVKVRPATDEATKWSTEITFTTDIAAPVPTNLSVTPAPTSAAVSWTGFADSYDLRYKVNTTPDFVSDFDDSSLGSWTTIDADGDGYNWEIYSACTNYLTAAPGVGDGRDGSADRVVSGSYTNVTNTALTPDNYLVSPQIALGGTITFWAYGQDDDTYYKEHFGVAVSTTGNTDAADFTTIEEWTMDAGKAWKQYSVDLSAYAGQTGYVAIRHFNCTDMFLLGIDDIVITLPDDDTPWTIIENISSNSYNLTGLTPETDYKVEVRGNYGSEGYGGWGGTSFTTVSQCAAPNTLAATGITHEAATLTWTGYQDSYNVQYRTAGGSEEYAFDDFENGDTGWTQNADGIYTGIPYSGTHMLVMGYETTDETQYLITPELSGLESGSTLQFYQRYYQSATTFKVGFSSTTADIDAFTWGDDQNAAGAYTLFSAEIPAGTKYIAIQHTSDAQGNALFIDDCGIYGSYVAPGEWQTATANEPTLALTGLTAGTEYEWQVQGISESCGGTTDWSESATFTTAVALANAADNSGIVEANDGKTCTVVLAGRTLYKDDSWNTLCLPFDVDLTADGCPLAGASARKLNSASITGNTLNLTFGTDVSLMEAGVPYIIKWADGDDIVNPVFANVVVKNELHPAEFTDVDFAGSYAPVVITASGGDNTMLYLSDDNKLYWPNAPMTIGAQRAVFHLKNGYFAASLGTDAKGISGFSIDFGDGATGISNFTPDLSSSGEPEGGYWYSLDGVRLKGRPTAKGVYINNGRKVVVK